MTWSIANCTRLWLSISIRQMRTSWSYQDCHSYARQLTKAVWSNLFTQTTLMTTDDVWGFGRVVPFHRRVHPLTILCSEGQGGTRKQRVDVKTGSGIGPNCSEMNNYIKTQNTESSENSRSTQTQSTKCVVMFDSQQCPTVSNKFLSNHSVLQYDSVGRAKMQMHKQSWGRV